MASYADDRLKTAKTLDSIAAAITQTSPKVQNKLTSVLAGKLGALGTAGGIMGLLSFLSASTGTAIASLSGTAATTAKLFWVGSIVGGGVTVWASVSIRYSVLLTQDKASALDVNVLHLVGLFL